VVAVAVAGSLRKMAIKMVWC